MSKYEAWATVMVTGLDSQAQAQQVNEAIGQMAELLSAIPGVRGSWSVDCLTHEYTPGEDDPR